MKEKRMRWLLCSMLVLTIMSCMKDFELDVSYINGQGQGTPWITTGDVSAISNTDATVTGGLKRKDMEAGIGQIYEFGVIYSSENYGDLNYNGTYVPVTDEKATPDNFTITLQELKGGTTYYYCTYIRTDQGEYTGRVKNFVTLPAEVPHPSLPVVTDRTEQGIYVQSTVEGENMEQEYSKGFYWKLVTSTFEEPSRENHDGSQELNWMDSYSAFVNFDSPDAIYAIRAYVYSYETDETVYSETLFCALKEGAMVSPVMLSEVSSGTVMFRAMALNFDAMTITEKGFCYSMEHSNPAVDADTKVVDTTSEAADRIEATVEGLDVSEHFYYVRAYCVADGITYYGPTYIYGTREPGIYTVEDLIAFRDARNRNGDVSMWKNGKGEINLFSNLDMSTVAQWIPISNLERGEVFNGNGFTISNLNLTAYNLENYNYEFGFIVNNQGTVNKLKIGIGSQVSMELPENKNGYAGSVCVYNHKYGVVTDCMSAMNINLSSKSNSEGIYVGGLVGKNWGLIENCTFAGEINVQSVSAIAGGIAAEMTVDSDVYPKIVSCVNTGTIGNEWQCIYIGGILGQSNGASVLSCINEGIVTGNKESEGVGGIVGRGNIYNFDRYTLIDQCINSGEVNNGKNTGGIAGLLDGGVTNCKNTAAVSSEGFVGSICGAVGSGMNMFTENTNEGTVNGVAGDYYIGQDKRPPLISDVTVVSHTDTSAVLSATILDQGGELVKDAGFRYSTIDETYNTTTVKGVLEGNVVTCTLTDLTPKTKYFVWGYASNSYNTINSTNSVSFETDTKKL